MKYFICENRFHNFKDVNDSTFIIMFSTTLLNVLTNLYLDFLFFLELLKRLYQTQSISFLALQLSRMLIYIFYICKMHSQHPILSFLFSNDNDEVKIDY